MPLDLHPEGEAMPVPQMPARDEQIILGGVEHARFVQLVSRDLVLEVVARL